MSAYTKPILRYGLLTPVLTHLVLLLIVLGLTGKLQKERRIKEDRYNQQLARLGSIKSLDAEIAPRRKTFEGQKTILQTDPSQLFTRICDTILSKYKHIELERIGMVFPLDRGRIARQVHSDMVRVKSSFEGGFGPMQETLLQIEALMPHAVLEELKVTSKEDNVGNKPGHLIFEMSHVCWKSSEVIP